MAKTKEELISMIENDLVDSTSQKITGASVKNVMLEMVETIAESAGKGGNMEYWGVTDFSSLGNAMDYVGLIMLLARAERDGQIYVVSSAMAGAFSDYLTAFAIDKSIKVIFNNTSMTGEEVISMMEQEEGVSWDSLGLTPMTEEEFYAM